MAFSGVIDVETASYYACAINYVHTAIVRTSHCGISMCRKVATVSYSVIKL